MKRITPREVSILALFQQRLVEPTEEAIKDVERSLKEMEVCEEVEKIIYSILDEARRALNKKK